nr:helix-turn-helix domain-containing protein [Amycolatopsis rifamycinica]
MAMTSGPEGLGTRMRHVLETLDGDVARFLADIGLDDYRPRYSPVVRALLARGPLAIRDLAEEMRVTHSAASQTVAQMNRAGFVSLAPGADARQRIVSLTARTRELLPLIEAEWTATTEATEALEAELPYSLRALLDAIEEALERKPFRERIGETAAARELS